MDCKWIGSVFLLVFLCGCATIPRTPPTTPSSLTLQDLCGRYNIDCRWDGISQTVDMVYAGKKIRAMIASNIVIVNDQRLVLGDVLRRHRGLILLPSDFEQVVMGLAAKPQDDGQRIARAGRIRKILIDAGHGGKDPGAIGYRGLKEKEVNLDIAQRLARNFQQIGIAATLTRDTDEFLSLQERTLLASQSGADLFLSVHANAHKSRTANGIDVYYADPLSIADQLSDQRQSNEKTLFAKLNMTRDNADLRKIVADMLYCYKLSFSPGLAESVARGLSLETSGRIRGSKPQRFYVLRNTLVPAILVEVGFVTNPAEAKMLQDQAYRQRIADAITKSVLRYGNDSGM